MCTQIYTCRSVRGVSLCKLSTFVHEYVHVGVCVPVQTRWVQRPQPHKISMSENLVKMGDISAKMSKIMGGRTGPADPATVRPMFAVWCLKIQQMQSQRS